MTTAITRITLAEGKIDRGGVCKMVTKMGFLTGKQLQNHDWNVALDLSGIELPVNRL